MESKFKQFTKAARGALSSLSGTMLIMWIIWAAVYYYGFKFATGTDQMSKEVLLVIGILAVLSSLIVRTYFSLEELSKNIDNFTKIIERGQPPEVDTRKILVESAEMRRKINRALGNIEAQKLDKEIQLTITDPNCLRCDKDFAQGHKASLGSGCICNNCFEIIVNTEIPEVNRILQEGIKSLAEFEASSLPLGIIIKTSLVGLQVTMNTREVIVDLYAGCKAKQYESVFLLYNNASYLDLKKHPTEYPKLEQ